jgi:hypothetical protein
MASKEFRTYNCENESKSKFAPDVDVVGDMNLQTLICQDWCDGVSKD